MNEESLREGMKLLAERKRLLEIDVSKKGTTNGPWKVMREWSWDGEYGTEELIDVPGNIAAAIVQYKLAEVERRLIALGIDLK